MKKMTICDYLARTVPQQAYEVLEESGYEFEKPKNTSELATLLKKYMALDRELALKKLAEIHPDKDLLQSLDREVKESDYDYQHSKHPNMLIQDYQNPYNRTPFRVGAPIMMGANGCGGYSNFCPTCGSGNYSFNGFMNCDGGCGCGGKCGGSMNADGNGSKKDYTPLYVAIGIFAIALYFAEVKRKG